MYRLKETNYLNERLADRMAKCNREIAENVPDKALETGEREIRELWQNRQLDKDEDSGIDRSKEYVGGRTADRDGESLVCNYLPTHESCLWCQKVSTISSSHLLISLANVC